MGSGKKYIPLYCNLAPDKIIIMAKQVISVHLEITPIH